MSDFINTAAPYVLALLGTCIAATTRDTEDASELPFVTGLLVIMSAVYWSGAAA
ncbi:hypothetical protein [Roseibium algae]|uniref:Uncharacterized protein n=1 Tax=Roseibium algae TaxID=3123038 RepID=A0ABU8TQI6_9HYPH